MSKLDQIRGLRERQFGGSPKRRAMGKAAGGPKPGYGVNRPSEADTALLERLLRRYGVDWIGRAVKHYAAWLERQRGYMRARRAKHG